jgi:hypothetical protein
MITQEQQDALERWRLKRSEIERFMGNNFNIADCANSTGLLLDQCRINFPDLIVIANAFDDLLEQNKDLENKLARMPNANKNS